MTDPTVWVALSVIPRKEAVTARTLRLRGYEVFLPMYSVKRRWSDRMKLVDQPLFPGYLFCRLDPKHRLPVLKIETVIGLAGPPKSVEAVPDEEIAALQTVCGPGSNVIPCPYLFAGAKVTIQDGPFKGVEGILLEEKPARLVLSVTLLQRSVSVEVERDWIAPVRVYKQA